MTVEPTAVEMPDGASTLTRNDAPAAVDQGGESGSAMETRTLGGPASTAVHTQQRIGRFEIRRFLGEGAFGAVYEGHDPQLDRAVAIKVAKLGQGDSSQRVKRFLREAKAAAGLRHPNIVPVHEFGQEGDQFYIVSSFIKGQTLQAVIKERHKSGGAPDLKEAVRVGRRLAEALAYAHRQGIVHRDVKPANVLTDETGEPMLTDFGLAARQDDAEQLTHQGQVLGTPLYMAPEQARGQDGVVSPAVDQYALGVMLYEMIVGKRPFEGTPELVMHYHQSMEPTSPRQRNRAVSRDLETVCLKMLEKDPARRYANCEAAAEDLRRVSEGELIHARAITTRERVGRWTRRNPLSAALMAAVATSLLLGAVVSVGFAIRAETQAGIAKKNEGIAQEKEQLAQDAARIAKANEEIANTQTELAKKQAAIARANAERALRESEKAKKVSKFLGGLFDASDPVGLTGYAFGPDTKQAAQLTAHDVLLRGVEKIRTELKDEPETRAAVLITIGSVLRMRGQYKDAQPLLEEALELRKAVPTGREHELAEAWFQLGWLHHMRGDDPAGRKCYQQSLRLAEEYLTRIDAAAKDESSEADRLAARTLALDIVSRSEFNAAWLMTERKELHAAEALFRKVLKERRGRLGDHHVETAAAKAALASVLLHAKNVGGREVVRTGEALLLINDALKTFGDSLGDESVARAMSLSQEAIAAAAFGQYGVADEKMRKVSEITRQKLGETHPFVAWGLGIHGELLEKAGKKKEARERYVECIDVCRAGMGLDHQMVMRVVQRIAELKADAGDLEGGRAHYEEMFEAVVQRKGKSHFLAAQTAFQYGHFLSERRVYKDATVWLQKVIEINDRVPGYVDELACKACFYLGVCHADRPWKAVDYFRESVRIYDLVPNRVMDFGNRTHILNRLILALEMDDQASEAMQAFHEYETAVAVLTDDDPDRKKFIDAFRKRIPSRLVNEASRNVFWFAQPPIGSVTQWLGAINGLSMSRTFDSIVEIDPRPSETIVSVEKTISPESPIDPGSKRPVEPVTVRLKKGIRYQFDLRSTDVDSYLILFDAAGRLVAKDDDGGGFPNARIFWNCPLDGEYRLLTGSYGVKKFGKVVLKGTAWHSQPALCLASLHFRHDGELTDADLPADAPPKTHRVQKIPVKLFADNSYFIDLKSSTFDAMLRLENAEGKVLLSNDDGGIDRNSRIVYRPLSSGTYQLVVTTYEPQEQGAFTLTVRKRAQSHFIHESAEPRP